MQMKSTADTVKETSRKLMDYHLGTGRLPDWNDLFQGFSAAQELLAASNAQPKLLRVQRAWFKDQQSGKTVEIVISSDAQVDWLGVNEMQIRGCSKPWVRVSEEVARNIPTEKSANECSMKHRSGTWDDVRTGETPAPRRDSHE